MEVLFEKDTRHRYSGVTDEKAGGATYTPELLADFVAQQIVATARTLPEDRAVRVLDPAMGDGALLLSLLKRLDARTRTRTEVHGFETDPDALRAAARRIHQFDPGVPVNFLRRNFLDFVVDEHGFGGNGSLFRETVPETYDLIIANPPYVRTQVMGANRSRLLADQFALTGRVDLYYAFVLGIAKVLKPTGVAGIIVSNRFMTTRSGASVRREVLKRFHIRHVWDLGDTKLFEAAVLPAVLLAEGKSSRRRGAIRFTSIYETAAGTTLHVADPVDALSKDGVVRTEDGRRFVVRQGRLNTSGAPDGVWRIETKAVETWLATVKRHAWGRFRDIGRIRVGVKTCADKTFIRDDWNRLAGGRPELLRPLTTHHVGRRFKAAELQLPKEILYPHEVVQGTRRAVPLSDYPASKAYLEARRNALSSRKYLIEAGREWYELWVPQNPAAWSLPKLVFRDIAEKSTFWMDLGGSVVNGDCYWLVCEGRAKEDWLWLAAAVANSTFIERFYDHRYHNKLYAGRRRFITQYVEEFPLPDPEDKVGQAIISTARKIYDHIPSPRAEKLEKELDRMVWEAFGLAVEEVGR